MTEQHRLCLPTENTDGSSQSREFHTMQWPEARSFIPLPWILLNLLSLWSKTNSGNQRDTQSSAIYFENCFYASYLKVILLCYRSFLKSYECETRKMINIFHVYDTDFSLTHQLFNKHIHNIENSSFFNKSDDHV